MGQTFSEKILGKRAGQKVKAGDIVVVSPDRILSHDNTAAIINEFRKLGISQVRDPEKLVIVLDHVVPASSEKYAQNHKIIREFVREQRVRNFFDINHGICHQVLSEHGLAAPGTIVIGADSHTTTYGAFGAFSVGVGRSEVASVWATDELWLRVPETIKINLEGQLPPWVYAKDIILKIIGDQGADKANYQAVEFSGPGAKALSLASRMVLCNMAAEMGAKNAYFHPDKKVFDFFQELGISDYEVVTSDEDAQYSEVINLNLDKLEPQVACPHTVDNVRPVSEVEGLPFHQALIGTCTNGRLEDLEVAAQILRGKKVHPQVRVLIIPASQKELLKALEKGLIKIFNESGCVVINPGCGPCLGAHQGVLAPGEVALSTANRNFRGRMGSRDSFIYLASPATVAASAIEGRIKDPRKCLL
ncbi:MAG: 3-isopropylmalate dehydratase large subunit [Candidatus Aminicenantes bacterium]|mgnify:CR=1 FL=1|nr:MAG: 3-isopropylmalate dehydratase large subunit [Candidatus Aminicenantes bacterium]RLE05405.1 MAG: 3-isopropylmalate dehydratase large subunit [Candidatus Aminicenantes bacterium]